MKHAIRNGAFISIDGQQGCDDPAWARRNNSHAEANIARLLAMWQHCGWPVIHMQH